MRFSQALENDTEREYIDSFGGVKSFQTLDSENLMYLCATYAHIDDLKTSIDCYDTHISRFENSSDTNDIYITAYVLMSRAAMSFQLGNYESSIKFIDKDFAFMEKHELSTSFIFGDAYYAKSLDLYSIKLMALHRLGRTQEEEKTIQNIQSLMPWIRKQPVYGDILSGIVPRSTHYDHLAMAYYFTQRFTQAADLYRNDPDMIKDEYGKYDQAPFYIGKSYLESGHYDKAIKHFDMVNTSGVLLRNRLHLWMYWHDFSRVHLALGHHDKAIKLLKESVSIFESQRSNLASEQNKIGFVGDKQAVYADLVTALMDKGQYDEAFAYAERGKARALVDMLASKKQFSGGNTMNASELNRLLAQLEKAEKISNKSAASESDRSRTRGLILKRKTALIMRAPKLSSLVTVTATNVNEIQSLLPKDETLIEYYGSGDDLVAFVVSKQGIQGVKLNVSDLNNSITALRNSMLDLNSNAYKRHGKRLYRQLIAPLTKGIKTRNITIVPHGALHYLPFSALYSGNKFVLDQYNIRILPSAAVMKFLKANHNKTGSLLAFGNPDLGEARLDLPFAQKEAEMIVRKTAGAKLLTRKRATETAVKTYGNNFKYLHFASHGTFDAEKPLSSGLLLAKDKKNDGTLTVGELYDLNLNADLVTLSACETALGKIANGDDVVGFTRGFLYAGASSIVSSLWQVDDAATSVLMQNFYAGLKKTDKRTSLRHAQLVTKAKYTHPYYWAAFQLTGAIH